MSSNILYEGRFLAESFCVGVWLMMVYDILRVIRLVFPHHPLWAGVEDMIYWIYASITTFMLLYRMNDGGLRGFVIGGVFLGMVLYNGLVSRFLLKVLKKMLKSLKMRISAAIHFRRKQ